MHRYFLFFPFLFFIQLSFSQTETKDSIDFYLKKADKLYGVKKITPLKKAVFFANESNIDSLIRKTNVQLGVHSFYNKSLKDLKFANNNINNLYIKTKDSSLLAKQLHFKALEQKVKLNVDSAFYFYHQSKNISKNLKDSLAVGRRLLSMSIMQFNAKDYLASEISSIEALYYLEPIKSNKYLVSLYNVLGLASSQFKKKEAEVFYKKALKINDLLPSSSRKTSDFLYITNNLGLLYQN